MSLMSLLSAPDLSQDGYELDEEATERDLESESEEEPESEGEEEPEYEGEEEPEYEGEEEPESESEEPESESEEEPETESKEEEPESESEEEPESKSKEEPKSESDEEGFPQSKRLYKNQKFSDKDTFKQSVISYALRTGRNLKQYRYDEDKIGFKCVGGNFCAWKIYASCLPNDETWRVRLFIDKHSCAPNEQCKLLKVPVIAMMFRGKIREERHYYTAMKIQEIVKEKWKIDVSMPQCQAARNKVLRDIKSESDDIYPHSRFDDYKDELLKWNKDSFVKIDTMKNARSYYFYYRFYVCLDVLRRTWKESCRPLIGVGCCSIKSKMKGNVLVAVGRDANNAIYPIAWAGVQEKNSNDWFWFVRNLKESLALNDGDVYIMLSDWQKELIKAVKLELPKIEHRKCVRHIYKNVKRECRMYYSWDNDEHKKLTKGLQKVKPLIWKLACSYNKASYKDTLGHFLSDVNHDRSVMEVVVYSQPKSWCRAFYKKGNYCKDVENNLTKSFINSISKAREKALVTWLETIRRVAMTRIAKRSKLSHDYKGICTPYVIRFLAEEHKKASQCILTEGTNGDYKSVLSGRSYCVNLEKRTCSCMKFEICGIPCEHAYSVIMVKKLIPENFVCHWFRTSTWKRNYEKNLYPVEELQPLLHDQLHRKKVTKADKKRNKDVNQSPNKNQPKQKKRIMHCKTCGTAGHNSRFHKKQSKEVWFEEFSRLCGTLTQSSQGIGSN